MDEYMGEHRRSKMTVLLLAYDELEYVQLAVDSLRRFGDIELSLVIVDNSSTDGLRDWAAEQEDLSYVLLDEGHMGWGKAINMVIAELGIDSDLLIMEGHYAVTPGYLKCLQEVLYQSDNVGGISNGVPFHQSIMPDITDYATAVSKAAQQKNLQARQVMMLHHGAILLKKGILGRLGPFEERVDGMPAVIKDYCLRMIVADEKLMVSPQALLWNMRNSGKSIIHPEDIERGWEQKVLEEKWKMHYFNGSYNENLILQIEADTEARFNVLEIGCDCGATLLEIKNRYSRAGVFGVEINEKAASIAAHFAEVEVNNIEDKSLPFAEGMFDYIIFGDVLEHLHDPLDTLVYCKKLLGDGGCIIANIPNIMHISVMEQLLRGEFTYTETGLLDKTHIHFFTYHEINRIFRQAGYEICDIRSVVLSLSESQNMLIDQLLGMDGRASRFMYDTYQYCVKACLS